MKGFVCKVCGFISINGSAPDACPVCHAPKESFEEKEDAIKTPADANNLTDLEKKHVPVITHPLHVKIGEIQHPMVKEHYITHIDFYIDKEFISRVILTPDRLNPAAALHLKVKSGRLSVIELCNIHGAWIKEADLQENRDNF